MYNQIRCFILIKQRLSFLIGTSNSKGLTELNQSIHTDIVPFIISAVKDVKRELDVLRNTTTATVSGLWKHWNRTDAEIEDIIKLISQQNEIFHFIIAYHSDVLYPR